MIEEIDFEKASKLIEKSDTEKPMVCPNCNSLNISFGFGKSKYKKYLLIVLSLLINTPFNNLKGNYCCKDCKCEF